MGVYLTMGEAARRLGTSRATARKYLRLFEIRVCRGLDARERLVRADDVGRLAAALKGGRLRREEAIGRNLTSPRRTAPTSGKRGIPFLVRVIPRDPR